MTISTTNRKAGPFAGNDAQTVFAFAFKVFTTADALVVQADATGAETTLTLGVDYTVTLNGDQDAAPGGDVTLTTALPTGETLIISSNVSALQGVEVTNGGGFFPSVFNGVFDRLTILIQQLIESINRTIKVSITSGLSGLTITPEAGGLLQFNNAGDAIISISRTELGVQIALPDQTGAAGKALISDGDNAVWGEVVDTTARASATAAQGTANTAVANAAAAQAAADAAAAAVVAGDATTLASAKNFAIAMAVAFS